MATLKIKARSPFWYVQFKDGSGKWKTKATKYRRDNPQHTKEARMRVKENTLEERLARKVTPDEKWENWVEKFFNLHCSKDTNTKESYLVSWAWLHSYFVEKGNLRTMWAAQRYVYASYRSDDLLATAIKEKANAPRVHVEHMHKDGKSAIMTSYHHPTTTI